MPSYSFNPPLKSVLDIQFPVQFSLFGEHFFPHYVLEALAFFIGVRVYYGLKRGTQDPISDENRLWIMLGAMIGALVGSRVIAVLETPQELQTISWYTLFTSKTIAGGLLGGLFGVELIKKAIGVNIASGDLYIVPILTALFIGRIGCFLMGIAEPTFGIETHFVLGMNLGDGLKRHPVALYEMIYLIFLLLVFRALQNRKMINGDRFKLFMVMYFLYRFLAEFIKPYHSLLLNLSIIHWTSIFIFLYYYKFLGRIVPYFIKPKTNGQH